MWCHLNAGGEAAHLLSIVLHATQRAFWVDGNLQDLQQRALAYLELLRCYNTTIANPLQQNRDYHAVVADFKEYLQVKSLRHEVRRDKISSLMYIYI